MCLFLWERQVNLTWTKKDMLSGGLAASGRGLIPHMPEPDHPCLARKACKSNNFRCLYVDFCCLNCLCDLTNEIIYTQMLAHWEAFTQYQSQKKWYATIFSRTCLKSKFRISLWLHVYSHVFVEKLLCFTIYKLSTASYHIKQWSTGV